MSSRAGEVGERVLYSSEISLSGERVVSVDGVSEVSASEEERKESERRELVDVPEHSQKLLGGLGLSWLREDGGLGTLDTLGE